MSITRENKQVQVQALASKANITGLKAVKNNKLQIEVSEVKGGVNVLALLNKSDERFKQSARKAWLTAEPVDAKALFPSLSSQIDEVIKAGQGTSIECNVPAIMSNGIHLRVEIKEALAPMDDWQEENIMRAVKQNPTTQEVLLHANSPIFSKTSVVGNEPVDERITHDSTMPIAQFEAQLAQAMSGAVETTSAEQPA